jgi:hypothetical protein
VAKKIYDQLSKKPNKPIHQTRVPRAGDRHVSRSHRFGEESMSICRGIDKIQNRCLSKASGKYQNLDIHELLVEMVMTIEGNWQDSSRRRSGKRPSRENWRLEKRLHIAEHNTSPEKTLEKAIARFEGWYNQVPTASGLHNQNSDKLRNIDLVRQVAPSIFEFVELKVASKTPVYAAMESLIYAALYFFSLRNYSEEERASKVLLRAKTIRWLVLAPGLYYQSGDSHVGLDQRITGGLQSYAESHDVPCEMGFEYLAFPESFAWPCDDTVLAQSLGQLVRVESRRL